MTEEDIEKLISVVQQHYTNSTQPLYLSALGGKLNEVRKALVAEHGSLLAAIKSVAADKLDVINEDVPGSMVVVTPEKKEEIAARLSGVNSGSEALFDALPAPLRIAFCLKTESGQVVGVKLSAPMRYQRFENDMPLPTGFIAIDGKHRFPGLDLRAATSKEKDRLWKAFLTWADENGIDTDLLRKTAPQGNALERLLASQPAEILDRMILPADIVAILIRHS